MKCEEAVRKREQEMLKRCIDTLYTYNIINMCTYNKIEKQIDEMIK